jgi:hypothetical protein
MCNSERRKGVFNAGVGLIAMMIRSCWGRKRPPIFSEEDAATPRLGYIPAATTSFNAQLCGNFFPSL